VPVCELKSVWCPPKGPGVQTDAAVKAATQQVTEYADLLNEHSGSDMMFKPIILWLDEAGNVIREILQP